MTRRQFEILSYIVYGASTLIEGLLLLRLGVTIGEFALGVGCVVVSAMVGLLALDL